MSYEMTIEAAAAAIGVSRQTLYSRIQSGRYTNADPADIVRQEIAIRESELAQIRRRFAAFQGGDNGSNGSNENK